MNAKHILPLIFVFGVHTAWAGEEGRWATFLPTEEEKNTPFFERKSWVSTTHFAHYGPEDKDNRNIRMTLLNIGAEYYVRKNLGIVADAYLSSTRGQIIHSSDPDMQELESNSIGAGGSLGLKWHFLRGKRWSVFINGTLGFLYTGQEFPAGGTKLNFMERADLGVTFRLHEQWHLTASLSRVHVSNGKGLTQGNPSFTGNGGYVGFVYRFDQWRLFN